MPKQKPGKSKQDWQTPKELLGAVRNRLNIEQFDLDIAASDENAVCDFYYTEEDDALHATRIWHRNDSSYAKGWAWLNPPYENIEPWVKKAVVEAQNGAQIVMLVPASVGSNWWHDWVEPYAFRCYLNGRITFVGADGPYPKDCALLFYTPWGFTGSETWKWKRDVPQLPQIELGED